MNLITLFQLLAALAAYYLPLPVSFSLLLLSFFRVRKRRLLLGAVLVSGLGLGLACSIFVGDDHINKHLRSTFKEMASLLTVVFGVSLMLFLYTQDEKR